MHPGAGEEWCADTGITCAAMSTQKLSRAAYERLVAELTDLTTRGRIEVAEEIELARAEGDLRENAGYHAAKDKQGHMEGRIRQLEHLLDDVEVVDEGGQTVYTMIYAGDSPDDAERYVVGSQEERSGLPDDVTIVGPPPLSAPRFRPWMAPACWNTKGQPDGCPWRSSPSRRSDRSTP